MRIRNPPTLGRKGRLLPTLDAPVPALLAAMLLMAASPLAAQEGSPASAVERLLDQIVAGEQSFLGSLRAHTPLFETYIQEFAAEHDPLTQENPPIKDHYFLGRVHVGGVRHRNRLHLTTRQISPMADEQDGAKQRGAEYGERRDPGQQVEAVRRRSGQHRRAVLDGKPVQNLLIRLA